MSATVIPTKSDEALMAAPPTFAHGCAACAETVKAAETRQGRKRPTSTNASWRCRLSKPLLAFCQFNTGIQRGTTRILKVRKFPRRLVSASLARGDHPAYAAAGDRL